MKKPSKIKTGPEIGALVSRLQRQGKKIVFTNGCFDLLHVGHTRYLERARRTGDFLVVGLNSDRSIRKIKGPGRPVVPGGDRAELLAALACVDAVVFFSEPTPIKLIKMVNPDVLVKGADWPVSRIVGADFVKARGGKIKRISLAPGRSTSGIIKKIQNSKPGKSG